jgi:hypothetical protein
MRVAACCAVALLRCAAQSADGRNISAIAVCCDAVRIADAHRRRDSPGSAGTPFAMHGMRTARGAAMSICGVITTRDVLRQTATILREFGPRAYFRCCAAILRRRRTTFLNCVFAA